MDLMDIQVWLEWKVSVLDLCLMLIDLFPFLKIGRPGVPGERKW